MRARVIAYRPPRIAMLLVAGAAAVHWAAATMDLFVFASLPAGGGLVGVGFGIMMWGWWSFKKHEVAICPTARTERLITCGIYGFTRNPMYLGMILMLAGIALCAGTAPFYLAAVAYFAVINWVFCPYEEEKLRRAFGGQYTQYQGNVRRWL